MADQPLHRSPRALLGLLELKVLGKNPDKFAETLQPGIELLNFYAADLLSVAGPVGTITNPATSALAGEVVPQGQVWRVLSVHAQANVLAADAGNTYTGSVQFTPPSAVVVAVQAIGTMLPAGLTGTRYFAHQFSDPPVLTAGWRVGVGVWASAAPAVATSIGMVALIQRIRE